MHKRDVYSLITIDTSVCVKSDLGLSGWFTITVSIVESKSPSLSSDHQQYVCTNVVCDAQQQLCCPICAAQCVLYCVDNHIN